jgi:glycosyltransferase involved in cell wall biosynthesis
MSERYQPEAKECALTASVVITTFRRPEMLGELLVALCPQTVGRLVEIIVIDNCPDSSALPVVRQHQCAELRYKREPRGGVVYARNCGVAAACGEYLIFLDDDEVPRAGWLDAWLNQANGKTDASFGRIVARPMAPCPDGLAHQIDRIFGRDLNRMTGQEISPLWAYLGTGNAMFHKARCFGCDDPFDDRFNARGGEDVWLIRSLVGRGMRLLWNRDAAVDELVPAERMSFTYIQQRRFNQGQLRGILAFGHGGIAGILRVATWMVAGVIQYSFFQIAALLARAFAPRHVADLRCRASGGLGKLMWRAQAQVQQYGGIAGPLRAPNG